MDVFGILGLDPAAERVYQELVTSGSSSATDLAERTALPDDAVRAALAQLAELGLITRQVGTRERYAAAPPAVALGALLAEQRHALYRAELGLASLAEAYRSASSDSSARDLVEVLIGAHAVRHRFEQIQMSANSELHVMSEATHEVVASGESVAEEQAVDRGVRYHVIIERAMLDFPGAFEGLTAHMKHQQLCRVVEKVPTKLVVADRSVALVPLSDGSNPDGGEPAAMFVRAPGLIRLLIGLYESVWERAVPVRLAEPNVIELDEPETEPTGLDLRILSLLMVGATDAAIAKQLGLGLRTVQRRVAHMMDLAKVSTRLQLGWQACHRGWLVGVEA
jgi:sugar-specific transcriptional regulator TrmB